MSAADKSMEISQKNFHAFKSNLNDKGNMTLISVTARSVENVHFLTKITGANVYRKIELQIF